jgi:hypothetical protein
MAVGLDRSMSQVKSVALKVVSIALLALGVGALLVWSKDRRHPVTREVREACRELKALPQDSPEFAAAWDRHRDRLYEMVLARHPELVVSYKEVPDERNGFLKWVAFEAKHRDQGAEPLSIPDDIQSLIEGKTWDANRAEQWLTEHAALMGEIEAIGLLPEQSMKGVERPLMGYIETRLAKQSMDLLWMSARLQAERGKPEEALRKFQAVLGLANHFDQVEAPCLLDATVGAMIRLNAPRQFFQTIYPLIAKDPASLQAWRKTLDVPPATPSEYGRILQGEWHAGQRDVMPVILFPMVGDFPWMGDLSKLRFPRDSGDLLDAFAESAEKRVRVCRSNDWADLVANRCAVLADRKWLSRKSVKILDAFEVRMRAWAKGWIWAQLCFAQQNAAFAHLFGEPLPNEPITGKPFVWDEASQSIRAPEDERLKGFDLKPLVVKRPY